jgi:hypothetical protein
MLSRIAEWINDAIYAFFNGMLNDLISLVTGGIIAINSMALELMQMDYVRNTVLLVQVVAGTIMVVRIAYVSLTTYILYQNGEDSADPKKLLFEAFTGAALVSSTPWLAIWVFSLGSNLAKDLANVISFQSQDVPLISLVLGSTFAFVLIALIAVVLLLLIFVQAAVRAVEVCLLAVMGPILAVGGLNNELFSAWWKNLLVVSLTQAVQIFLLKGVFVSIGLTNHEVGPYLFLVLGFLWVTWKTPNVLKEYAYSTGTGQAIGGAAQQAGTYVLMRRMLTRV